MGVIYMMDMLLALVAAIAIGFIAAGLVHLRARKTVFRRIRGNVGIAAFVLFLSFFLYAILGFSIWTVTIIPIVSLLIVLFVIRNGIGKLLQVK